MSPRDYRNSVTVAEQRHRGRIRLKLHSEHKGNAEAHEQKQKRSVYTSRLHFNVSFAHSSQAGDLGQRVITGDTQDISRYLHF
jgi:hypothetical protein